MTPLLFLLTVCPLKARFQDCNYGHLRVTSAPLDPSRRVLIRCTSPDGALTLVAKQVDHDTQIGFEGMPWHTHGDILAKLSGLSIQVAIERFVESIVQDKTVLALLHRGEALVDVWVTDDPSKDAKYAEPEEVFAFRYWSGTQLT